MKLSEVKHLTELKKEKNLTVWTGPESDLDRIRRYLWALFRPNSTTKPARIHNMHPHHANCVDRRFLTDNPLGWEKARADNKRRRGRTHKDVIEPEQETGEPTI